MSDDLTIFFDVDGVLNKKADWVRPYTINEECLSAFVKLVKQMQKKYTVKLVITSTWRTGLSNSGNDSPQIKSLCNALRKYGLTINGATPFGKNKSRQDEISYYARRNKLSRFFILDDDESLYPEPKNMPLYITNYNPCGRENPRF